jgi:hypothetical protein
MIFTHCENSTTPGLCSLLKNSRDAWQFPSAAEAVIENIAFIAAVNRCATQKQGQSSSFFSTL